MAALPIMPARCAPAAMPPSARAAWRFKLATLFVEGRNLTDNRYAATVIAAQNNLGGVDSAAWRSLLQMLDVRLDTGLKRSVAVAAARNVFALFETSGQRIVETGHLG